MPNQGDVANVYAFVILHLGLLHTSGNTREDRRLPHPNKPAIDRALVGDPGSALMSQKLKANVCTQPVRHGGAQIRSRLHA